MAVDAWLAARGSAMRDTPSRPRSTGRNCGTPRSVGATPRARASAPVARAWARCALLVAAALLAPRGATGGVGAGPAPPGAAFAVNWALASAGATATANNAGYYAGYTAEARYALDGDTHTFWSSTGGATCCSESQPAWLLVNLGAARAVATLQLLVRQDLTYTLAAGNASTGPFAVVAGHTCAVCKQNSDLLQTGSWLETFALQRPVVAAYFKLTVTWSSHGGIGGCESLCDWASNVFEFRAYSPGPLPAEAVESAGVAPQPPSAALQVACSRRVVPLVTQEDDGRGARLSGDAARQPRGGGVAGGGWTSLTSANQAHRKGSVEFSRVVRPRLDCGCESTNFLLFTAYVRLGGGTSMPGEGLAISLVDASRQTPGATRFLTGCGTRPLLPAHAVSVVLDTSDNDPTCDEPGTGARVVSTLAGAHTPLVLGNTLDMRTTSFRNGGWVPIQFEIENANVRHSTSVAADGSWEAIQRVDDTVDLFAPFHIWADGSILVDASIMYGQKAAELRLSNASLDAFYVVVSGRTGDISSDGHAISGLRVECRPAALTTTFVVNWDGLRQPLPASPPPQAPIPPQWSSAELQQRSPAQLAGASFAVTFFCAMAAIGCACFMRSRAEQQRSVEVLCRVESTRSLAKSEEAEAPLLADAAGLSDKQPQPGALVAVPLTPPVPHLLPDEAQLDGFDLFLSYRRVDYRLADAVHDKLRLCGLRVFKDIDGRMAGSPFGTELIRAVRAAPVFAPVITLPSLQRMATAANPGAEVDTTLGECLAGLYFHSTGDVRLIHPLLAGPQQPPHEPGGKRPARWSSLPAQRAYDDAVAALPDAVPAATHASVAASMRAAFGLVLPPDFAALTVRDIMCGRGGEAPRPGVLTGTTFAVDCLPDDLGLYIRDRYAPPALAVAAEVAAERGSRPQTVLRSI